MRSLVLAAAVLGGCASSVERRDFVRDRIGDVPLRSVAVVAVVSAAEALDDAEVDVAPFSTPMGSEALDEAREIDGSLSSEVAAAFAEALIRAGYDATPADVDPSDDLDAARSAQSTDAVLLVRAVPLDRLSFVDERPEAQVIDGSGEIGGVLPQRFGATRRLRGRVFLSQVFLFDRKTGARLFSQQVPGLPGDRVLREGVGLLDYGLTGAKARGVEAAELGKAAAAAFAARVVQDLPRPSRGTPEGRAWLDAVDVAGEAASERFFDTSHLVAEVGSGWSFEGIGTGSQLPDGARLPELGAGAFAPLGALQLLRGQLTWVVPGGFSLSGYAVTGEIPNEFSRTVVSAPEGGNARLGSQRVGYGQLVGGGLGAGQVLGLGSRWFLHPTGFLFAEQWQHPVSPPGSFDGGTRTRTGIEGRLDVWWMPAGPLLLRAGLHGRIGLDSLGPAFGGTGLSLGAGFVL